MIQSTSAENSRHRVETAESLVLDLLGDGRFHTLEDLLEQAQEFSWAELFVAMESLGRNQVIELRRQGFTYWLRKACLGE
jgi:hypothetical protein